MKRLTLIILMLAFCIGVFAQKVKKIEYFFDTDPGIGAGTPVTNFTPATTIEDFIFSVPVDGLTNGFHKLYVRCLDESNRWSLATKRLLYKQDVPVAFNPQVTKLEYFIDTDPGVDNASQVNFTSASAWEDKPFTINLTSFSNGFHKLYIRAMDDAGNWSMATSKLFYHQQVVAATNAKIKKFEYFIDADPGIGSATSIAIATPAATIEDKSLTIDLTDVTSGFHKLNIRALDDLGNWSTSVSKSFYMDVIPATENLNITEVEYYFDTDPGLGNGTNISFTQGANIDVQGSVDLTGLSKGFHKIHLRAKDNIGRWSLSTSKSFYMDVIPIQSLPNIVAGEYFFDTDPGLGNGTAINVTPANVLTDQTFSISLSSVTQGFHKLNIRYKDSDGNWSVTSQNRFYKDISVPAVATQIAEVSYYVDMGSELAMNEFIKVANFTPALDVKDFVFSVDLTGKEVGKYYLYAYAKDFSDRYTTMAIDSFKICDNVARAKYSFEVASRTVTFTDESELAANYYWNFGDGATSTDANPVHTYALNGSYNVCLSISNDCNESVFCDSVTVIYNAPPTSASFYVYTDEDKDITFNSGLFSYSDEEGNAMDHILITALALSEGDSLVLNDTLVLVNTIIKKADIAKLLYKPASEQAGYRGTVNFKVHDGIGYCTSEYSISFQVTSINDAPTFTLSTSTISIIQNSGAVTIEDWLIGIDDGDPNENQTLSASITVIDGASLFAIQPQLLNSDYSDITFTINNDVTGSSRLKLTVTDYSTAGNPYQNTVEEEFTITVTEFKAQLSANKTKACVGAEITFTTSSPTAGIDFAWDFGSGASPKTSNVSNPNPVTYNTSGTKTVKLIIAGYGKTDTKSINITIVDNPDASFLTGSNLFPLYDTIEFYNTSTSGGKFEWDFGDGSAKLTKYTTESVKHYYSAKDNDVFTATLTATNDICTDVFIQEVKFIDAQPPVISVREFPAAYNFNETKKVSVLAQDVFYGIQNAKFYYKGVSGNQWGVKNVAVTNDSIFETTIEETMGDAVGIEYYFDVFNKIGIKGKSEIGYAYLSFDNGIDIPDLTFGTTVEDYQIISIPLNLDVTSVDSVFEELGGYDNTQWRMFHYNPNKLLEYKTDFDNIERGKGYWLIARNKVTINTGTGTTNPTGKFDYFKIPLRQGWTQIGNPYNFDIYWSDVLAANSANASKIGNLRNYKNGNFVDDSILRRFGGGFVFADESGIELTIPVQKVSSTKSMSLKSDEGLTNNNWQINMQLSADNLQNMIIGFGMNEQAISGKDQFDDMTVPRFFNYLEGNFNHPDYFYPKFSKDIVEPAESHVWDFDVETNLNGETVFLKWESDNANQLSQQVRLVDLKSRKVVNMKNTSQYLFIADGKRNFKICYGNDQFLDSVITFNQSSLGDCYPNPFKNRTVIPIYLTGSDKCTIDVSIYSIDGRKIATIAQGEYQEGFHEIIWEPGMNSPLNAGIYFYTLTNYTEGTSFTKQISLIK